MRKVDVYFINPQKKANIVHWSFPHNSPLKEREVKVKQIATRQIWHTKTTLFYKAKM